MKKILSLLLLLSLVFFFACGPDSSNNKDDDDTDDIDTPVVPVEPDTPKKPDTPDKPDNPNVFTRPDLGNDGINEGKEYGWNTGVLSGLTETITGNVSSAQYFYAQGLDAGWNVGNGFDGSVTNETNWGNPTINQALFDGVRAQGFTIVRLPITWNSAIGSSPNYTINTTALNRVAEVVGYAHNAGLAVIINTHHDNNTWPLPASTSAGNYSTATAKFTALWQQVADKFKDYGDWLIFEPINEPRNGNNWNSDPNGTMYAVLNNWNQVFVDTVRASGSNNEHRYLVVKQYCAKPFLVMDYLELPTDSSPKKLILDFHYYDPEQLCLDGTRLEWNGEDNGSSVRYSFEDFYGEFYQEGLPIIIGECGVSYQGARTGSDAEKANASRYEYLEFMGRAARENGMTPILWDNGSHSTTKNNENFGLFNRTTGVPNSTFSKAAIDAFLKGVRE